MASHLVWFGNQGAECEVLAVDSGLGQIEYE